MITEIETAEGILGYDVLDVFEVIYTVHINWSKNGN